MRPSRPRQRPIGRGEPGLGAHPQGRFSGLGGGLCNGHVRQWQRANLASPLGLAAAKSRSAIDRERPITRSYGAPGGGSFGRAAGGGERRAECPSSRIAAAADGRLGSVDRSQLEHLLRDRVFVPGADGPCDAEAKARMRQDYLAYHDRITAYGKARRDALIKARRSRCPKKDDPA